MTGSRSTGSPAPRRRWSGPHRLGSRWHRRMHAHDPEAEHRAATPLELLFDLAFVVAVGFAVEQFTHAVLAGHPGTAVGGFCMVFFAIWWAWVNFSHFASVYDTDDVPYRLLTMVQIGGVLMLAAGVGPAFVHGDFTVIVIGYVVMRVALLCQWLRAAAQYPPGRVTSLWFAGGILVVQLCWIGRLWLPGAWAVPSFVVLALAELAVPVLAENRGPTTRWHPGHLAERYSLFALIVLGEQVVGSTHALTEGLHAREELGALIGVAVAALVIFMAMWWLYFARYAAHPRRSLAGTLGWAYGHYLLLGSIAATGGAVEVAIAAVREPEVPAGPTLAVAVAVYLLALWALFAARDTRPGWARLADPVGAVVVVLLGFTGGWLWGTVAVLVVLVAVTVATDERATAGT